MTYHFVVPLVFRPLPHVADEVVEAEVVGRELVHGARADVAVLSRVVARERALEYVRPGSINVYIARFILCMSPNNR